MEVLDALPLRLFHPASGGSATSSNGSSNNNIAEEVHRLRTDALVSGLQIASQLARHSEAHFPSLQQVFSADKLAYLLTHRSATVRAKTCNLLGNLCRHSDRCYPLLQSQVSVPMYARSGSGRTLISLLSDCCGDSDPTTRKFASFAIGNAAFHSQSLYPLLRNCIAPLCRTLETPRGASDKTNQSSAKPNDKEDAWESDDKTKANAAGALGNLVRNSGELAEEMAKQDAVWRLATLLPISPHKSSSNNNHNNNNYNNGHSDLATQRIALFSLGTMAVYAATREQLVSLGDGRWVEEVVRTFGAAQSSEAAGDAFSRNTDIASARDETMMKYATRLKQKLRQPLVSS